MARYIEQNPIRAKIVKKAEQFSYSSARAHITGRRDDILGEELFEERQRRNYREMIKAILPEEEMQSIKYSTKTGRPFGRKTFIEAMEKKLQRRFILRLPGRPRKEKRK